MRQLLELRAPETGTPGIRNMAQGILNPGLAGQYFAGRGWWGRVWQAARGAAERGDTSQGESSGLREAMRAYGKPRVITDEARKRGNRV